MTLGDVIGEAILKHANQKGPNPEPMWKVVERDVTAWLNEPRVHEEWPESPDPAEGLGALLEKEKL